MKAAPLAIVAQFSPPDRESEAHISTLPKEKLDAARMFLQDDRRMARVR
jgi:hypothetical protein